LEKTASNSFSKPQRAGVRYSGVKAALTGSSDHVRRIINANHLRPHRNESLRQCAVAATQIKDALARLGLEQFQHGLAERRHEMSMIGIANRIPSLRHG
jgi:hypothetical protein